jgi:hypothetical protein
MRDAISLMNYTESHLCKSLAVTAVVGAIDSVGPIRPMRLTGLMGRRLKVARDGVAGLGGSLGTTLGIVIVALW